MAFQKINIDYAGLDTNEIVRDFFNQTSLATDFGARVVPGMKSKAVFHTIQETLTLHPYQCVNTEVDDIVLTQKGIDLCSVTLNAQFCRDAIIQTYREKYLGQGVWNESIMNDQMLSQMILEMILERGMQLSDEALLTGGTYGGTNLCTGLLALFEDDADVIRYTVNPAQINPANIITIFNEVEDLLPVELQNNKTFPVKFAVSADIGRNYRRYLQQERLFNAQTAYVPGAKVPMLYGDMIEVVQLNNLPPSTIFATYPRNIILVFDDMPAESAIRVVDKSQFSAFDNNIEIAMPFRQGVNYGFGDKIVYGTTA